MSESTAVATKKTWTDLMQDNMGSFQAALPRVGITAERLVKSYMVSMRLNPELAKCSPGSVVSTILQAAEVGLELSPTLGQAYPVPFKGECTLIIGYKGFITLMKRSGEVTDVKATIVYENEVFEMAEGTEPYLKHTPLPPEKRGEKIIGCYVVVIYRDGSTSYEFMWLGDILKHRDKSPAAKSSKSPWNDPEVGYKEMIKKTVIRRIAKRSALSANNVHLLKAVTIDEGNEAGIRFGEFLPEEEERPALSSTVKPAEKKPEDKKETGWTCPPTAPECQFFVTHGDEPHCDRENKVCDKV